MALKFFKTWRRRLSFRGLSIQQRLPILICFLLLSVIIAGGVVSYFKVRNDAISSGTERLNSSGGQLVNMLGNSSQTLVNLNRSIAQYPAIGDYLKQKDTAAYNEAFRFLQQQPDTSTVLFEVLDPALNPVIRFQRPGSENISYKALAGDIKPDTGKLGNFYFNNDQLYYPTYSGIVRENELAGFLVRWRKVSNTRSIDQIVKLMGLGDAKIYFGSLSNNVWTDMVKPVDFPIPVEVERKNNVLFYKKNGNNKMLAIQQPVKLTTWNVVIEESQQSLMMPVRNFLNELILIGSILLFVGIVWAWLMSRNITRPLNKLTAATSLIAGGNYSATVAVDRRDEIGKLARSFNAMVSQLRKTRERLEQKVIEAEGANEQLRNLSAHLQNIREEERIHIAREMHDELGQLLTGFKMDVSWLHKRLGDNEDPVVREKLQEMMSIVNDAAKFVRKLASELRPSILDDLGLIPALDWHSQEFKRRAHIDVEFKTSLNELKTSELIATGLFRMYQESLTNVARHAEARKVVSQLEIRNDNAVLTIKDDGKGFDLNGTGERKTLGLLGMKERATMLGGNLDIHSSPGKGTTITITVPLQPTASKQPAFS